MQAKPGAVPTVRNLLTARQVQDLLGIDRSTVYRMADDGRLPAIRVGKQWRFPEDQINSLLATSPGSNTESPTPYPPAPRAPSTTPVNAVAAQTAVQVAAELLGVTMVVTDMSGRPITMVANPCAWFTQHAQNASAMAQCASEWRELADEHTFTAEFRTAAPGFQCARTFIRSGHELVAMVVAGGVCQPGDSRSDFHELSPEARAEVLRTLPIIAAAISKQSRTPDMYPLQDSSDSSDRTQVNLEASR